MLKILKLCLNVYSYFFLKKILELYYYKLNFWFLKFQAYNRVHIY